MSSVHFRQNKKIMYMNVNAQYEKYSLISRYRTLCNKAQARIDIFFKGGGVGGRVEEENFEKKNVC